MNVIVNIIITLALIFAYHIFIADEYYSEIEKIKTEQPKIYAFDISGYLKKRKAEIIASYVASGGKKQASQSEIAKQITDELADAFSQVVRDQDYVIDSKCVVDGNFIELSFGGRDDKRKE